MAVAGRGPLWLSGASQDLYVTRAPRLGSGAATAAAGLRQKCWAARLERPRGEVLDGAAGENGRTKKPMMEEEIALIRGGKVRILARLSALQLITRPPD